MTILLLACVILLACLVYQCERVREQNEEIRDQNARQLEYWARQDQWNVDYLRFLYALPPRPEITDGGSKK